ncbi:MAG: family 78 glycoside hydrolase catalytic domain [Lachnospiraceae bacterium]|nr:family 78 glycoside hydrolase catalytic domain [Lachnospiraceae bacterium]
MSKEGGLPVRWEAKWIDPELVHAPEERQPAAVLRKRFVLDQPEHATLFITCHGLYVARINGTRVGAFELAPGTGDYHKRLFVQRYDVTKFLVEGDNEITVTLGDGWYRGSVGIDGLRNYYGEDLALLCQLETEDEVLLASDESWEATSEGPTRENDLQQGETYDARREALVGWHGVKVRTFGYENLAADTGVPILAQERFEGKLIVTPNGQTVIDFGQNLAGYTELCVQAKEGQKITLWHGETLDENGNFTQKNFDPGDRNKNGGIPQKITYICKEGRNVYHPSFAIFGFRYALLETDIDLSGASFSAVAVYSKMPQTGYFTCANEDVNRLFLNSLWSMRSNFCDIPTDCPTRERAGWTGDAGAFAPTAVYLADCLPVFRKWLGECRLAQGEDGLVQNIAPVNNKGGMISNMLQGSAGWGDACILVPWALYEAYADAKILEENYEMMQGWMRFVGKRAAKTRPHNLLNPYHKYLVDEGFHFGEWCQPDVDNTEAMKKTMMSGAPEVATAYYYRSASLMTKIARILGKEEDAKEYEKTALGARNAYRRCCLKNGEIHSKRQCEYVRPLAFGLLEGEEIPAAAAKLNQLVAENGYHLNTGFLSTPDLCRVLAENGYADTAYRLLLQDTCPGWLYEVKKGATTIWETWDGVKEDGTVHDSLNHYSYGAVVGWLFGGVCGIHLSEGKLTIAPMPGKELGHARAEWKAPIGEIVSAWAYEDKKLTFDIKVPMAATIVLPNGEPHEVAAGEYHYTVVL